MQNWKNIGKLMLSVLFTIIFSVTTYSYWSQGQMIVMIVPLFLTALGTMATAIYAKKLAK